MVIGFKVGLNFKTDFVHRSLIKANMAYLYNLRETLWG